MQDKPVRSETLAMLSIVLKKALKAPISFHASPPDDEELNDLGARLGKAILFAYENRETDPDALEVIAVKSVLEG